MKRILFAGLVLLVACQTAPKVDPVAEKNAVLATDSAFSAMSENKGMAAAFLYYADSNVVELNTDEYPTVGLSAMAQRLSGADNSRFSFSWKPLKCEVAASGDLAYTFGDWTIHQAMSNDVDTVLYGNYVSVWKKQSNGNWKYVLDAGTSSPGPTPGYLK